jgi:hypothetical protein
VILLTGKSNHSPSGAEDPTAQARPDEASSRPCRAGGEVSPGREGARGPPTRGAGGPGGPALNLSKGAICGHDDGRTGQTPIGPEPPDDNAPIFYSNAERAARRKRSRLYHRMISGMKWHSDKHLRHMVLTSSPLSNEKEMNNHKKALVKRIERLTINKLIKKKLYQQIEGKTLLW